MDLLIVFVFGLVMGSFYNVVGMRFLDREKGQGELIQLIKGRSYCPRCGHTLGVFDLLPLISYLMLLGKCRYCHSNISPLYFLGELLTGITFAGIYTNIGWHPELLVHLALGSLLVISTITDLIEKIVLNKVVVFFAILILSMRILLHISVDLSIWYYLASGGFLFILLMAVMILSGNKMGGGDVKLYGIIGLTIGILDAFASLFFASIAGLLIMIPGLATGKVNRKTEIPFVPLIWLGVIITYFVDVTALLLRY